MPPVRQEFNAKGRQSTGGRRKKGKIKKRKPAGPAKEDDPNAEIIVKNDAIEKEQSRREQLKEACFIGFSKEVYFTEDRI
jgi:ATP-dependent RNA helicase DHX37/DHR1